MIAKPEPYLNNVTRMLFLVGAPGCQQPSLPAIDVAHALTACNAGAFGVIGHWRPYASKRGASAEVLARGECLVTHGVYKNGIPACVACHGAAFTGLEPYIPGLLGRRAACIGAQLGATARTRRWRILAPAFLQLFSNCHASHTALPGMQQDIWLDDS